MYVIYSYAMYLNTVVNIVKLSIHEAIPMI